jgi:hypothetical protein
VVTFRLTRGVTAALIGALRLTGAANARGAKRESIAKVSRRKDGLEESESRERISNIGSVELDGGASGRMGQCSRTDLDLLTSRRLERLRSSQHHLNVLQIHFDDKRKVDGKSCSRCQIRTALLCALSPRSRHFAKAQESKKCHRMVTSTVSFTIFYATLNTSLKNAVRSTSEYSHKPSKSNRLQELII